MDTLYQFNPEQAFEWGVRLAVLFLCLPVHEFAHAWAAYKLGDDTAARQGRLTLNPFAHLDIIGSALLFFAGFGWAKPVPVDARVFRQPRRDMAIVAAAGPLSNIIMAFVMMSAIRVVANMSTPGSAFPAFGVVQVLHIMVSINLLLAAFNLLPIPPLDGSRLLSALLPERHYFTLMRYERFIFFGMIFLLLSGVLGGPIFWLRDLLYDFIFNITRPIDLLFGR